MWDAIFAAGKAGRFTYSPPPLHHASITPTVLNCSPFGTLGDRDFRIRPQRVGLHSGKQGSRKHFRRVSGALCRGVGCILGSICDDNHLLAAKVIFCDLLSPVLEESLRNPYTRHFMHFAHAPTEDCSIPSRVNFALAILSEYRLIGIYDSLQTFVDALCDELAVPRKLLSHINRTTIRPRVDEISQKLSSCLQQLTSADSELFDAAKLLVAPKVGPTPRPSEAGSAHCNDNPFAANPRFAGKESSWWYTSVPQNAVDIISSAVTGFDGLAELRTGAWAKFEFHAQLRVRVRKLLVGIPIFEESGRQIFGTNSDLLGRHFSDVARGAIRLRFDIRLNLAPGRYVAGLALVDAEPGQHERLLGRWDRLIDFEIPPQSVDFVGITRLDSDVSVSALA